MAEAGCRVVQVPAAHLAAPVSLVVLYPAVSIEAPTPLGPYVVDVALDGVAAAGPWPVVVISHGSGGSGLTHRDLGRHLARRGFLVLLPEHPGNNREDNHLAHTAAILEQRPRDVAAALDWAGSPAGHPWEADLRHVGIVGHSLGGYTALALAGGRPTAFARETPDGRPHAIAVTPDPRVAALVLFAPAAPWFLADDSLASVRTPTLMLTGEHDRLTGDHGELIAARLPATTPLRHRVVEGAGHFSFLAPFPPDRTNPAFPPSQDPPGFDRVAFHATLYPEVRAFLERHLAAPATSGVPLA